VAARQQPEPQRLLFVFASTELPEEHSEIEAQRFASGQGGALNPIMYVGKTPDELGSFADLVVESQQMGQPWEIVFVASLAGRMGTLPEDKETQEALEMMVKSIQQGAISSFLAYDREGMPIQFE